MSLLRPQPATHQSSLETISVEPSTLPLAAFRDLPGSTRNKQDKLKRGILECALQSGRPSHLLRRPVQE